VADHRLIIAYRRDLLARLPAELAEEVSDGLADAQEHYLRLGQNLDDAAMAAIAEFGEPATVLDAFRKSWPAWRLARILIFTGPIVGGLWAAELITGRAWGWPVPDAARLAVGLVLLASVALLITATRTRHYQSLRRAAVAGGLGIAVLDGSVVMTAMLLAPAFGWLLTIATCVSAARLAFVAGSLRRVSRRHGRPGSAES
jgi:hypothetical protein